MDDLYVTGVNYTGVMLQWIETNMGACIKERFTTLPVHDYAVQDYEFPVSVNNNLAWKVK